MIIDAISDQEELYDLPNPYISVSWQGRQVEILDPFSLAWTNVQTNQKLQSMMACSGRVSAEAGYSDADGYLGIIKIEFDFAPQESCDKKSDEPSEENSSEKAQETEA